MQRHSRYENTNLLLCQSCLLLCQFSLHLNAQLHDGYPSVPRGSLCVLLDNSDHCRVRPAVLTDSRERRPSPTRDCPDGSAGRIQWACRHVGQPSVQVDPDAVPDHSSVL